jgi:ABC-type Fe3+-hydroxamate transport system substrate-binding protein
MKTSDPSVPKRKQQTFSDKNEDKWRNPCFPASKLTRDSRMITCVHVQAHTIVRTRMPIEPIFRSLRSYTVFASAPLLLVAATSLSDLRTQDADAAELQSSKTRIASFAPSNTELLYAIKASDKLVGVCNSCDTPHEVVHKERVGTFTSANLERLSRLKPDVILLVNGQEALSNILQRSGFQTMVLSNNHIDDVSKNLIKLGTLTNLQPAANEKAKRFEAAIDQLRKVVQSLKKPSVFFCVWPQPLLTVGNNSFLNDAITICGGINIASAMSQDYPHFSLERLLVNDPDVIILPYETQGQSFLKRQPWIKLKAVRQGQVFFLPPAATDGLSRPSLRLIDGLYWLSSRLHPESAKTLEDWHFRNLRQFAASHSERENTTLSKRATR